MKANFLSAAAILWLMLFLGWHISGASSSTTFQIHIIPAPQCYDSQDNDSDGFIDFPADLDCDSETDDNEAIVVNAPSTRRGSSTSVPVILPPTSLRFFGLAYPHASVALLLDGVAYQATKVSASGSFEINIGEAAAGSHIFILKATDASARISPLVSIPMSLQTGETGTISAILFPPTVAMEKSQVRHGSSFKVFGTAPAFSSVDVTWDGTTTKTTAGENGDYFVLMETKGHNDGTYTLSVKAVLNGNDSKINDKVSFSIDALPTEKINGEEIIGDINGDHSVNITDFSVMVYWFKRPYPPTEIDLDKDGAVTIYDMSILAYYWTG